MGDRCSLTVIIHGHLETAVALSAIAETIKRLDMENGTFAGEPASEFIGALRASDNPAFTHDECYTDDIAPLEEVLQALNMPYHVCHSAGNDYSAGCWSWTPEHGKVYAIQAPDYGDVICAASLRAALDKPDPLAAVTEIYENTVIAGGFYLPLFTASPEVSAVLGIDKEKAPC